MKRLALILLLLAALAGGAVLLARPGAQASPDVTITVNSIDDTEDPDAFLTLREAMKLATGELSVGDLTGAECVQVSGTIWNSAQGCKMLFPLTNPPPGPSSPDTIVFDTGAFPPTSHGTITLGSMLPELHTGNDTVDGSSAGVIVDGGVNYVICFLIASDNNTIKGLEIYNCHRTGVEVSWAGHNNAIGGSSPAERNVISGNGVGVRIYFGGANSVKGNYIGTDASGTAAMPNVIGVEIANAAQNRVGGSGSGEGNVIAFNTHDGVRILAPDGPANGNTISGNSIHSNGRNGITNQGGGNTISGNSIHSNGEKGIENNYGLAPPIVDSATGSASGHTNPKCYPCTVEVFSDDEDEGRIYHGSTTTNNDATGTWAYTGAVTGPNVTATITDAAGNTSEFSAPVAVSTATPTPTPTPTPTGSATPTPTRTVTPTPTPPVGPTRTLTWGSGWHNETWSGASTPQEAFACAAGSYTAAYRLVNGAWERYFPDRPDLSNMTDLEQYDAFLILITQPVTCTMPVAAAPGATRTLQWAAGWHSEGWSGPDGTTPENAFACAAGNYAAAYRLVNGAWERYFPGRPDLSNMGPLNKYDAFLVLVTAPVSCAMPIAP
jgi:hypothetical protein